MSQSSQEQVARVPHEPMMDMAITRKPDLVLAEAQDAARALKSVIDAKPKKVVIGGSTYLEFEDWQTVGRFYGVAPQITSTKFVEFGDAHGFEAAAQAVHVPSGKVVASAEAMCLDDEEEWSSRPKYEYHFEKKSGGTTADDPGKNEIVWEDNPNKPGSKRPKKVKVHVGEEAVPLFQLRSMAQTRAGAKALRNALAWVVVLAGYKPTPAEEMDGAEPSGALDVTPPKAQPSPQARPPAPPTPPPQAAGNGGAAEDEPLDPWWPELRTPTGNYRFPKLQRKAIERGVGPAALEDYVKVKYGVSGMQFLSRVRAGEVFDDLEDNRIPTTTRAERAEAEDKLI